MKGTRFLPSPLSVKSHPLKKTATHRLSAIWRRVSFAGFISRFDSMGTVDHAVHRFPGLQSSLHAFGSVPKFPDFRILSSKFLKGG